MLNPTTLLKKSKSLAAIDAILCQEWEYRYFSHNSKWGDNQEMGSMRDGEGNDYFIFFNESLVAIKGCFAEAGRGEDVDYIKNIKFKIPDVYRDFKMEPAFSINDATFVLWFDKELDDWVKLYPSNIENNGYDFLMGWILNDFGFYKKWAEDYYEEEVNINLVKQIFEFKPLSIDALLSKYPTIDKNILLDDLNEIGYPFY